VAPDVRRGEIWWATLPPPKGSGSGYRRPVLVIQSDVFNRSRIETVIVAVISSNLDLAIAAGNVLVRAEDSRLPRDSVVNVSQVVTYDRQILREHVSSLTEALMDHVDAGLRLVLTV
jgi:mRNA interferase MazF